MSPSLIFLNAIVAHSPSPYIKDFAAATESLLLHDITKYMKRSCNSLNDPPPLPAYLVNHLSTRYELYQRSMHVRGEMDWIQEVTSSSEAYGKSKLTS